MTYEEASDIYKRITGISVSPDSLESYTKKVGQKVHEMECEHARELMDNPELAAQESEAGMQANGGDAEDPIYLEIDGSHLNTRENGCEWKENKLAVAFRQSDIKHCGKEEEATEAKKQTPLRNLYGYLNDRKESMRYAEFRKKGYHIGNGAIESANKYVIQKRMKQAGMRWTFKGANSLATLRIRYLKDSWDQLWKPGGVAWAA